MQVASRNRGKRRFHFLDARGSVQYRRLNSVCAIAQPRATHPAVCPVQDLLPEVRIHILKRGQHLAKRTVEFASVFLSYSGH